MEAGGDAKHVFLFTCPYRTYHMPIYLLLVHTGLSLKPPGTSIQAFLRNLLEEKRRKTIYQDVTGWTSLAIDHVLVAWNNFLSCLSWTTCLVLMSPHYATGYPSKSVLNHLEIISPGVYIAKHIT